MQNNKVLISVYNNKGGVGKTSLSFVLCKDLDYNYSTNDNINSAIPLNILENITEIKNIEKDLLDNNIILDCGGFVDKRLKDYIKISKYLIIPIENSNNSIATLNIIYKDILKIYNEDNIIIVANKIENEKDFEELKKTLKDLNIKSKIIKIRKSKIFDRVLEENKGIIELSNKNLFNKYIYKGILEDYTNLINLLK